MLLGQRVESRCIAVILGLGCNRLHAAYSGRVDLRFQAFGFDAWTVAFRGPNLLDMDGPYPLIQPNTQTTAGTQSQICEKDGSG